MHAFFQLFALLECYVYIVGSKCQSTLTNNIRNAKNNIQQEQALIKLTKRQLLLDENDETSFSQMSNFDKLKAFIRNHENIVCRNDENDDRLVNRMAKLQMPERNRSDTISKKKSPKVLKQTDVNEKFRIHVKNYRMVCFERPNNEPLGITLQSDGNRCMIKRIIYGGFIHRIGNLHVGDEIHEINGRLISQMSTNSIRNYLALQEGIIRLKIITTSKTAAPPCDIYVKCLFNYDSTSDTIHPMNHQTNLEKKKQNISTKFLIGDIFQIISKDDSSFWQARKVHLEQSLCEGTFNGNFYFHSDAPELIPSPELQEMRITHIKTDENHQNKINQKSSYSCLPFPSSSSVSSSSSISSSATTTTTTTITTTITNSTNVVENVETKEKNQMTKGNDSDTSTPKNFSPKSRRSTLTNVDQFNVLTYEEVMLMPKFGRHSIILIGKETIDKKRIIEELLKLDGQFAYPISHTSRLPKNDEHDGKDYYFITWDEMMADIENNEFLEYGIHENAYYGRRLSTITDLIKNNRIALIDIDIKTFRPLRRGEFAPFVVFIRNDMSSGKEQLENESFMNSYSYLFDAIVSYSISSSPTLSPSSSPPTSNILTNRPTISVKSRTGVSSAVFDNYESTVYDNDGMFNEIANQIEKLFVLFTSTPQWIPVSWVY
ncbi:hypothetical protein SNEBB_007598 [Seison nebaliae]|nr:hypothetical protein SNEBB_007598 [Seison nebaliae]